MNLSNFLNPKYIAVIGASSDASKVGRMVFDNIAKSHNDLVFPINIKEKKVAGKKAYASVELLPVKNWSDLLVAVVVPARFVLTELVKCAELGIKNIVIISAGFKELGLSGAKMEKAIGVLAKKHSLNILGPNCLGFINQRNNLNLTFSDFNFSSTVIRKNNIALISQSGAIGSAILDFLANKNIGLSHFISLGNKAVLNENDFIELLAQDKKIDLIVVYLEEISQGQRFLEIVSRVSKIKPVAVLKAGRTEAGSKMALSHTGSLAGSYQITLAALERAGAIILNNMSDIYNLMRLVKDSVADNSGGLAVVSNAGGPVVLLADEASENNLTLATFSSSTIHQLKKSLPDFIAFKNPLDILGDADPERYQLAMEKALNDPKISYLLTILTPQSMTKVEKIAEVIAQVQKKFKNKIISTCFLGGQEIAKGKKILAENLIPNFDSVEEAISAWSKLIKYASSRNDIRDFKINDNVEYGFSFWLDYIESFQVLQSAGINVVLPKKVEKRNLDAIKYPVVIKFSGPDFIHKTDRQAIFLNVKSKKEAGEILKGFDNNLKRNMAVHQPIIKSQVELILGFKRDPVFGPLLLLGFGGIYTEVYNDVVIKIADVNKKEIKKMIESLRLYSILAGARGKDGINIDLLIETIYNFSKLVDKRKDILEVDINPLMADVKNVTAVDVRILIGKQ